MPCPGCGMSGYRSRCPSCEQKARERVDGVPEDHIDDPESNSHASRVAAQLRMAEEEEDDADE